MEIMLVGASVRAAAGSTLRAGCRPVAFDLFADADLRAGARATRIDPASYPAGAWDLLRDRAPAPWLYTGAIENHPDLVARLAGRSRLLGNGPEALRAVRDPLRLADACRRAGLPTPDVAVAPTRVPTDGSWLAKPVKSGGGEGIRPWHGEGPEADGSLIFQERKAGRSFSATFLASASGVELVGATRQYHGRPGNPFAYRGSLGPWRLPGTVAGVLGTLGRVLAEEFGLVGLFGVDLIVAGDRAWPVEVNPRYTASVEILEQGLRRPLLADHLRACGAEAPPAPPPRPSSRFAAKEVVYATFPVRWDGVLAGRYGLGEFPEVADVPAAGTRIEAGQPVLTAFGRGGTAAACRLDLARRVRRWRNRLRLDLA